MKKHTTPLSLIIIIMTALLTFAGCGTADTTEAIDADFTYSSGIDDNGLWKNVTALDYVELCDYENIFIPRDIHETTDEAVSSFEK